MIKKYYCYLDNKATDILEIKKLGIKIYKSTKEEKDKIYSNIKRYIEDNYLNLTIEEFFSSLDRANREYNEELNNKITNIKNIDDQYAYFKLLFNNRRLNEERIHLKLECYYTIEVDMECFGKIFSQSDFESFVKNIFKLSKFLVQDSTINSIYSEVVIEESEFEDIKTFDIGLKLEIFEAVFDYSGMKRIVKLLEKKDLDFIIHFYLLIDELFKEGTLVETKLVSKVSGIERLLLTSTENLYKNFVLRTGIICNNLEHDNQKLKNKLSAIYEVRSYLVHGKTEKYDFFAKLDKYEELFDIKDKNTDKISRRKELFEKMDIYLNKILHIILNEYVENEKLIEYIKSN